MAVEIPCTFGPEAHGPLAPSRVRGLSEPLPRQSTMSCFGARNRGEDPAATAADSGKKSTKCASENMVTVKTYEMDTRREGKTVLMAGTQETSTGQGIAIIYPASEHRRRWLSKM